MIQFLSSLIEWLALAALSSVGIEVEAVDCAAAAGPAEYRTISAIYVTGPDAVFVNTSLNSASLSDCAGAAGSLLRIDDTPLLVAEPRQSYRS